MPAHGDRLHIRALRSISGKVVLAGGNRAWGRHHVSQQNVIRLHCEFCKRLGSGESRPKGTGPAFQRSRKGPPDTPHLDFHPRDDTPGSAGSLPACCPFGGRFSSPCRFLIHRCTGCTGFFPGLCSRTSSNPQRSSPESASPAAASRPDYPVHPVHRCSIYSPSRGSAQSRGAGPGRRQTGVSQRGQAGFQRSRPPDTPHLTIGTTPPGSAGVPPHAVPSVAAQFPCDVAADRPAGGNRMGPAEAERRCRLIPVEEMAEAAGGFVRAGRPRSRVGFLP